MLLLRVILIFGSCFVYAIEFQTNKSVYNNLKFDHKTSLSDSSVKIKNRSIRVANRTFLLDGEPFRVLSGSIHYFRMPAQYWRDRLRKLKAAGLNSVSTYVEWSYHEPEERQYRFKMDYNITHFITLAAEENLHVLLRVGPYICAERDLGGFPYWLLSKYPQIKLRTADPNFLKETRIWIRKLFEHLTPMLYENGGPVILVQVENEYGSSVDTPDKMYKLHLSHIIGQHVKSKALLFTTDGLSQQSVKTGKVDGTLSTIDFGIGQNVTEAFKFVRRLDANCPLMNSEFYTGWLTHWGERYREVPTKAIISTLKDMLDNSINVNMYMFFGGTNFEFSSGANFIGKYQADITSYDYNAPLNEAGDPTKKYYAIRELMHQYNSDVKNIPAPTPSPKGAYGKMKLMPQLSLLSPEGRLHLGKQYKQVIGPELPTFEKLRQRAGLVMYETIINNSTWNGKLRILKPRDRIYVYVNQKFMGFIDRWSNKTQLIFSTKPDSILSLLVENMGRINFGTQIHDFKGILSKVTYDEVVLAGPWNIIGYPLENVDIKTHSMHRNITSGPVLYERKFLLPEGKQPLDTFLDTTGWGKGYIWVNGHNLGRYWPGTGPQITLFVPGVWLRKAPALNTLRILELESAPHIPTINFTQTLMLGCRTCNK